MRLPEVASGSTRATCARFASPAFTSSRSGSRRKGDHASQGSGGMGRTRGSRKRASGEGENENDPEVLELNRAVKRLNTGDAANRARANGGGALGGGAGTRGGKDVLPRLDENYETREEEREERRRERTTTKSVYSEINSMLKTLHFARVRRRESLVPQPPTETP